MSLVQPLVKPLVRSLVRPLVALGKSFYDLLKNIGEVWPLRSNLAGSDGTPITYTRASTKLYQDALGYWRAYTTDQAAFRAGLSVEDASTNKCTNYNFAPDAGLTNIVDGTDVTTSRTIPSQYPAMLSPLVDSGVANGYVFSSVNANVTLDRVVAILGATGSTNDFSLSLWARVVSGTGASLRLGNPTTPVTYFTNTDWQLIKLEGVTSGSVSTNMQILIDADTTIEWLGNQLEEGGLSSPIVTSGTTGTRASDSATVSTTGWAVNDCTYYIELPRGVSDNGANQCILDSTVDSSNFTRVFFIAASSTIAVQKRVAGADYFCTASYTADGTPLKISVAMDSSAGMVLTLSNGNSDTNANTSNLPLTTSARLGALQTGAVPLYGEIAYFARFDQATTDLTDLYWAARNG